MDKAMSFNLKCDSCGASLMDSKNPVDEQPGVHVKIEIEKKAMDLWLSPIYGSFNIKSAGEIAEKAIARFFCPQCSAEFKSKRVCESCGAPMIPLTLSEGGRVNICSRKGCKRHSLEFEDIDDAIGYFYKKYESA